MTDPPPTQDNPSDNVLEELLDAFSSDVTHDASLDGTDTADGSEGKSEQYDFDDPSIDRLLGITPEMTEATKATASSAKGESSKSKKEGRKSKKEPAAARKTIVIGGDDVPDTVPLDVEREEKFLERRDEEREAAGDPTRSTIVITDFDDVAPIDASAVRSTGGGDQRIRARRISVRRAEGRRRLRWVLVGLVAVAVPVGTLAVLASPIFDVNEVDVQGATYTDPALIAAVTSDMLGDPVLLVDTQAMERRLQADPWVERVRVQTDFPHRVVIDIRERRPVASFQGGDGRFRIIDYQGRVLDVIDGIPIDYMLITGEHPDTARGQFAGAPYSAAAELVLWLPSEIRAITESVGLNAATGALSLQLNTGTVAQLGDASDMDQKLARLLSEVRKGLGGICEVDVSTAEVGNVPC